MFELRSFVLPYCLQRQSDGSYQVFNRRYEPLLGGGVRFAKALTAQQIGGISWSGSIAHDGQGRIYLYNDGCIPTDSVPHWRGYSERLKRLASWHAVS